MSVHPRVHAELNAKMQARLCSADNSELGEGKQPAVLRFTVTPLEPRRTDGN